MGWRPRSLRSRIASRVLPRTQFPMASTPLLSGPRFSNAAVIARQAEICAGVRERAAIPSIPHNRNGSFRAQTVRRILATRRELARGLERVPGEPLEVQEAGRGLQPPSTYRPA